MKPNDEHMQADAGLREGVEALRNDLDREAGERDDRAQAAGATMTGTVYAAHASARYDIAQRLTDLLAQHPTPPAAGAGAGAEEELTENDVLSVEGGSMSTRDGEWSIDLFRSQNRVSRTDLRPMLTMQVYGPDYEETSDYVSFYLLPDDVAALHNLTRRFLALPGAQAQAEGGEAL